MRLPLAFLVILVSLSRCGSRSTETTTGSTDSSATDSDTVASNQRCFQQIVGKDSTMLRLTMNGSTVTGELAVLPFEKDRAVGSLSGILANGEIRADWQRSGEGVTQPYEVVFTMKGDTITWREGERIEKQGKWVLKNPDQGYQYVLTKTNCP